MADHDIDEHVRCFARFLRCTFDIATMQRGGDQDYWWCDFTQANWELLVEAALPWDQGVRLEIYGDGAEGSSSRVFQPNATPTHSVGCVPRNKGASRCRLTGSVIAPDHVLLFDRFVALEGGWYREAPPFDMVLVSSDEQDVLVLPIVDVQFQLLEQEPSVDDDDMRSE